MAQNTPPRAPSAADDYVDPDEVEEEIDIDDGDDGDDLMDEDIIVEDDAGDEAAFNYLDPEGAGLEHGGSTAGDDDDMAADEAIPDDSVAQFTMHTDSVYALDISPANDDLVVSGGGDDRSFLWTVSDPSAYIELKGHTDSVTDVAFSADGKFVASGAMDGLVKIWDTSNGEHVADLDGPDEIEWLTWHPRGNIILAGAHDGTVWMWGAKGSLMNVFSKHNGPVSCGTFTPDGKQVVTAAEDGSLIIWDPKTAARVFKLSKDEDGRFHDCAIHALAVNADNTLALTGGDDGRAIVSNLGTGKIISILEAHTGSVEAVGFSPVLHLAATGGLDGKVCIWDLSTSRLRHTLQHDDAVVKVAWYPTEALVVSLSTDKTVRLWDGRNGMQLRKFTGHTDVPLDMAMNKTGTRIVSAGDDQLVRVFQTAS